MKSEMPTSLPASPPRDLAQLAADLSLAVGPFKRPGGNTTREVSASRVAAMVRRLYRSSPRDNLRALARVVASPDLSRIAGFHDETRCHEALSAAQGGRRRVVFQFSDCGELDHALEWDDRSLSVETRADSDTTDVVSTWRAYSDFFSNRKTAELLFLDEDWSLAHGRPGFFDLETTGPKLLALERLLPSPAPPAGLLRESVLRASLELGAVASVERIAIPPRDVFLKGYAQPGRPFIATEATSEWPMSSWNFPDLAEAYGNRLTHLSQHPARVFPIRDFIERVGRDEPVGFKAAFPLVRQIREQYRYPSYFPRSAFFAKAQALIVAPSDAIESARYSATCWHRDWADNFLAQLIGRKRVYLSPPSDEACFYTTHAVAQSTNVAIDYSPISRRGADPVEFPAFQRARVIECVLEPGDMLYLPCGWFHHVENLSPSCAINCWKIAPASDVDPSVG